MLAYPYGQSFIKNLEIELKDSITIYQECSMSVMSPQVNGVGILQS